MYIKKKKVYIINIYKRKRKKEQENAATGQF